MTLIILPSNDLLWLFIQQAMLTLMVSLEFIALVSWWIFVRSEAKEKETDPL